MAHRYFSKAAEHVNGFDLNNLYMWIRGNSWFWMPGHVQLMSVTKVCPIDSVAIPALLYLCSMNPQYPLDKRLDGSQNW
jgi:hypothetical protein